jgi:hypothetical protein
MRARCSRLRIVVNAPTRFGVLVLGDKLDEVTCSQATETVSDPDTNGFARFYRAWLTPEYP